MRNVLLSFHWHRRIVLAVSVSISIVFLWSTFSLTASGTTFSLLPLPTPTRPLQIVVPDRSLASECRPCGMDIAHVSAVHVRFCTMAVSEHIVPCPATQSFPDDLLWSSKHSPVLRGFSSFTIPYSGLVKRTSHHKLRICDRNPSEKQQQQNTHARPKAPTQNARNLALRPRFPEQKEAVRVSSFLAMKATIAFRKLRVVDCAHTRPRFSSRSLRLFTSLFEGPTVAAGGF